jgi:hypothetical protein
MESVVFTYGRFNPPHIGHRLLIDKIIEIARKEKKKPVVVVSHSVGNNKNPLSVSSKMKILKSWYPKIKIIHSSKELSIAKITKKFNKNSVMVVGQNRGNAFKFLNFKKVPLKRNISAPSATMARQSAKLGNKKLFKSITGYNLTKTIQNKIISSSMKTKSKKK